MGKKKVIPIISIKRHYQTLLDKDDTVKLFRQ